MVRMSAERPKTKSLSATRGTNLCGEGSTSAGRERILAHPIGPDTNGALHG